tara:strand:+ start:589 stop:939 length:351 start_codon:yes stop_codon:yes gene_type:complete
MEDKRLSYAISEAAEGAGFVSYGNVTNEDDYNSNVVFLDESQKPSWSAVQSSLPSQQWKEIRSMRNFKLSNSDWTQLQDVPIVEAKLGEWQVYRQGLRDITTQPDPSNITWPVAPE